MEINKIHLGDCRELVKQLDDNSIDCLVTSPPYYGLRDYGIEGQLGLEVTYQEYLKGLLDLFAAVKPKIKNEGTCWVNLGDSFAGSGKGAGFEGECKEIFRFKKKPKQIENIPDKCLMLIPFRFALGMIDLGYILRNVIIWHKPNAMPQSCKDRFTVDFEYVFFFVKQKKYYFKQQFNPFSERSLRAFATKEQNDFTKKEVFSKSCAGFNAYILRNDAEGANMRTTWTINNACVEGNHGVSHVAMFPKQLVLRMLDSGCPEGGLVLDPFMGSGQTAIVAQWQRKNWIGFEISPDYIQEANTRIDREKDLFNDH